MFRRQFLRNGLLATGAASLTLPLTGNAGSTEKRRQPAGGKGFQLNYAPHFGMFRNSAGEDPLKELQYMAEMGFRAMEDNGMKDRPVELQSAIAKEMERLNMTMGVFVGHRIAWNDANLASGDTEKRKAFLADIRSSVEVAKRVNAKWMTVVPGCLDHRLAIEYQTANVIESLKQAAAILEPHGIIMVLEALNPYRDHPNLFLARSPQAFMICKSVNSPSCKILFDIYHQQITEGNLIPNIEKCWDEIAYFQIGDNPGRNEPTTGEINYRNVFKFIHSKGFQGVLGMEHGNSQRGKEGEMRLIEAYRESDMF